MGAVRVIVRGEGEIADALLPVVENSPRFSLCRDEGAGRGPADALVFDTSGRSESALEVETRARIVVGWSPEDALPLVLPAVNLDECLDHRGDLAVAPASAQLAAPILAALQPLLDPCYVETVTTFATASVNSRLRRELDGHLAATERALEQTGAVRAKAIAVITPAEPSPAMRLALSMIATREQLDFDEARAAAAAAVEGVRGYWPNCRPRGELEVRTRDTPWGRRRVASLDLTVGAADGTPPHEGNVAVTATAARIAGEAIAARQQSRAEARQALG